MITAYGWRGTFRFIGYFGLVVGALVFFLTPEPIRERKADEKENKKSAKMTPY